MKKLSLFFIIFLVGFSLAQAAQAKKAGVTTHEVKTEVVSADATAKTITIKGPDGKNMTAPVMGKAVNDLSKVKAGDKVTLTCQDNSKGEHEGVIAIKTDKK